MKIRLQGAVLILAMLGQGFTFAHEMAFFEEHNDTDSEQYDDDSDDLYQDGTLVYPGQSPEVEDLFQERDDDEYDGESDEDESMVEQGP